MVTQSRGAEAKKAGAPATVWVAQYAPHSASYVPVYVEADAVPDELATGSLHKVDHTSLYWAGALVGNWAGRLYDAAYPLARDRAGRRLGRARHPRRAPGERMPSERERTASQTRSSASSTASRRT